MSPGRAAPEIVHVAMHWWRASHSLAVEELVQSAKLLEPLQRHRRRDSCLAVDHPELWQDPAHLSQAAFPRELDPMIYDARRRVLSGLGFNDSKFHHTVQLTPFQPDPSNTIHSPPSSNLLDFGGDPTANQSPERFCT